MRISGTDYAEVMNLYAFYNLSSDSGAPDDYASCFTEDGVLKFDGTVVQQGKDALRAFKRADQAARAGRYRRHWNGSIHLEQIDANTIRGRCYLQAFDGDPGGEPHLADAAVYSDLIVKTNGTWKFAERELTFDFRTKA